MLAGSPLRNCSLRSRNTGSACAAHGKTAHPIDIFDKTDQRTLESFDSLAGRADCNACERRSDRTVFWPFRTRLRCWRPRSRGVARQTSIAFLNVMQHACGRFVDRSMPRLARRFALETVALGKICPSSLTSSNRTDTRFDTPDSSIVTP